MTMLASRLGRLSLLGLTATLLMACGSDDAGKADKGSVGVGGVAGNAVDNGFESDDPSLNSSRGGTTASAGASASVATSSGATSSGANSSGEAARAVEEADIIRAEGTRLYALSRYGGLSIIDITNPDKLKLLGRKRMDAMPFEMYVRGGQAYVMLNQFGHWVAAADGWGGEWVQSSEMLALDVTNPANITELSSYDVPGDIADSRMVGDALYLVTYENGYCWRCNRTPSTTVTSFNTTGGKFSQVQQLPFTSPTNGYSYWQRSVSATNERLYIAGPEWNWTASTQTANSVIQVVDITDPSGKMVKGADVPVAGQINNRWQMDEYEGVLRVVSQNGMSWSGGAAANPKVQTFKVVSASSITPLGETELKLPQPESLRSVRFDGLRAYAITARQTDPLFTIDLADPANPKQAGELQMPGWLFHMEPRGDRLVGFGFDGTTWGAGLQVSLFDVSDLTKPAMIKRVEFSSGSGSFAEDQDRIHKSIRVLDDQKTILVPFASYGYKADGTCGTPKSGIQIIDYTRDDLTLRGIAPQYGMPRRAVLLGDRLLGVSDRNVATFDITARDAPSKTSEMDLSNPAGRLTRVGDQIATITNDWWTGEALLSLTPASDAEGAALSGKLALGALLPGGTATCAYGSSSWANWYSARVFPVGKNAVVTVPLYKYEGAKRSGSLLVGVVDTSNPQAPKLISKTEVKLTERTIDGYGPYYYYGFWDGRDYYNSLGYAFGALVGSGEGIVQSGSKLAYLEVDTDYLKIELPSDAAGSSSYYPSFRYEPRVHRKLHVIDATEGANPKIHAPIDLGDSVVSAPLHLLGSTVMSSRMTKSSNAGKVRFYADRVDLSGETPQLLPGINVPGSLLAVDATSNRLVTVDYSRTTRKATSYEGCSWSSSLPSYFDYESSTCVSISRQLKLVDLVGTGVTLRQTWDPPAQNMCGVLTTGDRIYVTRYARYDYSTYDWSVANSKPKLLEEGGLWAISGIREGELRIVSELKGDAKWPIAAEGNRIAAYTPGGLAILDTSTPIPTVLVKNELRGWGYTSHVLIEKDQAIASVGEFGMQRFPLK